MGYFIGSLFRRDPSVAPAATSGAAMTAEITDRTSSRDAAEVGRIFMNVSRTQPLPPDDIRCVGQIVAQRTGLSQQDPEKRVSETYARAQAKVRDAEIAARDAADKARKASADTALWLFVSLLILAKDSPLRHPSCSMRWPRAKPGQRLASSASISAGARGTARLRCSLPPSVTR